MNELNPLIDAMNNIDDDIVLNAQKPKGAPLFIRVGIITGAAAVAAVFAFGAVWLVEFNRLPHGIVWNANNISSQSESTTGELSSVVGPIDNFEHGRFIYGKKEIPDITFPEYKESDGRYTAPMAEGKKHGLESMVFETHTFEDYTISLVGDYVRTDKEHFPGTIYTQELHVEVEKDGELIGGGGYTYPYSGMSTREYVIYEDQIGNYLDVYNTKYPIIAARYFGIDGVVLEEPFGKIVNFLWIEEDTVVSGFTGDFDENTGTIIGDGSPVEFTSSGFYAIFSADDFKVENENTLVDEKAGIKYIFNFDKPSNTITWFSTETIKKERFVYGETEIPDITYSKYQEDDGRAIVHLGEEYQQGLDSMVFETHTFGDYTIRLVGENVRTDKKHFPGVIYTRELYVEVENNGKLLTQKIGGSEWGDSVIELDNIRYSLPYGEQFSREYIILEDQIGNYIDVYDTKCPVIAMRYFNYTNVDEPLRKITEFAWIENDDSFVGGFLGTFAKNTGVTTGASPIEFSTGGFYAIFAADDFKVENENTLIDETAGIRYIFDFDKTDDTGHYYRTERIE